MTFLFFFLLLLKVIEGNGELSAKGLVHAKKNNPKLFEYNSLKNYTGRKVSHANSTVLKFVLDYGNKFNWESIVFFFSNSSEFSMALSPLVLNYFNAEGKLVAIHSTSNHLLPSSVLHRRHALGIVYVCEDPDEDFLTKVSELDLFDSYRSWLIISTNKKSTIKLEEIFRTVNLGLVTNLVVATIERKPVVPTITTTTSSTSPSPTVILIGYRKRHVEGLMNRSRRKREISADPNLMVHLTQVYKSSKTENETLNVNLGSWDAPNGMLKTKNIINPEMRWDLGGYKLTVGIRNASQDNRPGSSIISRFSFENEQDEESRFTELLDCLMYRVNASIDLVQFQKLGWRNEEGGWTHLLGSVVDGTVDFALETINQNVDKTQDMSFTYAIIITMNNIYFRRPKSGGLRDIFLAPFSPRLLFCVLTTSFLLAFAMISITIVNYQMIESKKVGSKFKILTRGRRERSVVVTSTEERKWEISEAALWSISVLCMQGSQWSPKSFSGSLLLINSLLFALIIYNSFAAFITSVLSVKDVKIKDLKDLAASEFSFGYTLGNSDELFLRTVNDTLLRELYFKGLRENDGVTDPIVGMHRAAKGKYAFFVGARIARRALRTVVAHERRCELQELYLPVTKSYASIPVARKSCLTKILNYKIIRLMEVGLLYRFQRLILPSMPGCVEKTLFNSARLADVYSAFFVLIVGWITSLLIFLAETVWHRRKKRKQVAVAVDKFKYNNFKLGDKIYWLR